MARVSDIVYGIGGAAAFISVLIYLFVPEGTVEYFGSDAPAPTEAMWCRAMSSADALVVWLCWNAVGNTEEQIVFSARGMFIYGMLHFGTFLHADAVGVTDLPPFVRVFCWAGIVGSTLCLIAWGQLPRLLSTDLLTKHRGEQSSEMAAPLQYDSNSVV